MENSREKYKTMWEQLIQELESLIADDFVIPPAKYGVEAVLGIAKDIEERMEGEK